MQNWLVIFIFAAVTFGNKTLIKYIEKLLQAAVSPRKNTPLCGEIVQSNKSSGRCLETIPMAPLCTFILLLSLS
jgi:hypothetical protein